eukprot:8430070-Pyramimonas_sp.AAC.1
MDHIRSPGSFFLKRRISVFASTWSAMSTRNSIRSSSSEGEKGQLRAVFGGIGWIARQAGPDEASTASLLQSTCCSAVMKDTSDANSAGRRLKAGAALGRRFVPVPPDEARVASVRDG